MYPLWQEAEAALAGIAEQVVKYDSDGVDVHFLNSPQMLVGAKSAHDIRELFQHVGPYGESTPTEVKVSYVAESGGARRRRCDSDMSLCTDICRSKSCSRSM